MMTELYARDSQSGGLFANRGACLAAISILVRRLGGKVTLTQADFDEIFGYKLWGDYDPTTDVITLDVVHDAPSLS